MGKYQIILVLMVSMVIFFEVSSVFSLCNLSDDELNTCKPAVAKTDPVAPSAECCTAAGKVDWSCLCSYKNSLWLPLYGIDPDRVMQLPVLCGSSSTHVNC
ncbi:hypothetical protein ACHQM5_028089 [Ranunculus cassubicifolius]